MFRKSGPPADVDLHVIRVQSMSLSSTVDWALAGQRGRRIAEGKQLFARRFLISSDTCWRFDSVIVVGYRRVLYFVLSDSGTESLLWWLSYFKVRPMLNGRVWRWQLRSRGFSAQPVHGKQPRRTCMIVCSVNMHCVPKSCDHVFDDKLNWTRTVL